MWNMLCTFGFVALVSATPPLDQPYLSNIENFARFDGASNDGLRIGGLSGADSTGQPGIAFQVIYRHPQSNLAGASQFQDATIFVLERSRGAPFDQCRKHPNIPGNETMCRMRTNLRICLGTTDSREYANRGAPLGTPGTYPVRGFNPSFENARVSAQAALGTPGLINECVWTRGAKTTSSLSMQIKLAQDGYPYPQISFIDPIKATVNNNGGLNQWQFAVPSVRPAEGDSDYFGTNGANSNAWHVAIVTIDPIPNTDTSSNVSLYVDGALFASEITNEDIRIDNQQAYNLQFLGGRPLGGRGFLGDIAKFRSFRRTINPNQVNLLFTNGALSTVQAGQFVSLDFPGSDAEASALATQIEINRGRTGRLTTTSLHFDGDGDCLTLPTLVLPTSFTVEIFFKIEYESPNDWTLLSMRTSDPDDTSVFQIRRRADPQYNDSVPDGIEILYGRDESVATSNNNMVQNRRVLTDSILVPGVWHQLVVAVTNNYDIMARVDGTLISHGQFRRYNPPQTAPHISWDQSYVGAQNPNYGYFAGNIGAVRIYAATLGYTDMNILKNIPVNPIQGLLRYRWDMQNQVDLRTTGINNTGTSSSVTNGIAMPNETAIAVQQGDRNAPSWDSVIANPIYLRNGQVGTSARFGGSLRGENGQQTVTGSGMVIPPFTLANGGSTVEMIYRHNNFSDDILSYVNDVLVDFRNQGQINASSCQPMPGQNSPRCASAANKRECVGTAAWPQVTPYPILNGKYAPAVYGRPSNTNSNSDCVWVDQSIDDTVLSMNYVRRRAVTNTSTTPQIALRLYYKDPRFNAYDASGSGRQYSVTLLTDPIGIDSDFGTWHHLMVVSPLSASAGAWEIWLDGRVITGQTPDINSRLGAYDDFRPGFVRGTPMMGIRLDNNHLGSGPFQQNTHQGNIAAIRVYDSSLSVPQIVGAFNTTRGYSVVDGVIGQSTVLNVSFADPIYSVANVQLSADVLDQVRSNYIQADRPVFEFDDQGDYVTLPAITLPNAFTVSVVFRPLLDLQNTFSLLSLVSGNLGALDNVFEIMGVNFTHGKITMTRSGRSSVVWQGNWPVRFRAINVLIVTIMPTGEVHARLNGVVLCHGGLNGGTPTEGDEIVFDRGFINAKRDGYGSMNGVYGSVRIYSGALSYSEVASMFSNDYDGPLNSLLHDWTFEVDVSNPTTIPDSIGAANGMIQGNPVHGLLFSRVNLTANDYVLFSGRTNDALALPSMTIGSDAQGLTIETIFQWTDTCPIEDSKFCAHIRDSCTHTIPEYVGAVLANNVNFPGLEGCITSVCCYCDYGYSSEPECSTTPIDWGPVIGSSTINAGCILLNTGVFAPQFLTSVAPLQYRLGCSDYQQCPFQVETPGRAAANGSNTAMCKYLEGTCTTGLESIVVGGSADEECVTSMCCFCDMGHSNKQVCNNNFDFRVLGTQGTSSMTLNAMCLDLVETAPHYDLLCLDSPFDLVRYNNAEVYTLQNSGTQIENQCTSIQNDPLCADFRSVAAINDVTEMEACCGDLPCNISLSDAAPMESVAYDENSRRCSFSIPESDDAKVQLRRVVESADQVARGTLRSGLMQTRYIDNTRTTRNPVSGGRNQWGVYVPGEPISNGNQRYKYWHHAITTVTADGNWTYWLNGEVASGQRVSGGTGDGSSDYLARRGTLSTSDGRSVMPQTQFNANRLGFKMQGRIGRFKVYNREASLQEIENSFANGADISGAMFDLNDAMPYAFRNSLAGPGDNFRQTWRTTGLRFDSNLQGETTHEHVDFGSIKLPTSFTLRLLVKPYFLNSQSPLLSFFSYSPGSTDYAQYLLVARENNGGIRVEFKDPVDTGTVIARTGAQLFQHDETHEIIIQVTAADLPSQRAQITIIFDDTVVNHGSYDGKQAVVGSEIDMNQARINSGIGDIRYPNPMTFYAAQIYEDAVGYDMCKPFGNPPTTPIVCAGFNPNKLKYSWTFNDTVSMSNKVVENYAPGYAGAPGTGTIVGDATVEYGQGGIVHADAWQHRVIEYKEMPGSGSDRVSNTIDGGVNLGKNGTTFEIVFNTSVATPDDARTQNQHLFDIYDDNGTPNFAGDDRRMRLFQSSRQVENGNWYQTSFVFEWLDGARAAIAPNLMLGPEQSFGFRLETAPHWPAWIATRFHHILLTVTPDGQWTMWMDGEVISGFLGLIPSPNVGVDTRTRFLAHPGSVTAEPICRDSDTVGNCNTNFSYVVVGGTVGTGTIGGEGSFQGDISLFRIMPFAINPFQAATMSRNGPDISLGRCSAGEVCLNETTSPIIDWIPCREQSMVGATCNDYDGSTIMDSCNADGFCFGLDQSAIGALNQANGSSSSSGVIIIIVVAAVALIAIAVIAALYVKKIKTGNTKERNEVSFENPMYDESVAKENPVYDVDNNEDEASGYMDLPGVQTYDTAGSGGYMDVAPTDEGGYMDVSPDLDEDGDV